MAFKINNAALIPVQPDQAVDAGWTSATGNRPMGITWHWTATRDLQLCRETLGGPNPSRKGQASAHYGIGRSFAEGVDRYVSLENRAWHAGINQTMRWDGKPIDEKRAFKGTRTTIGIETVNIGFARAGVPAGPDWITAAEPNGKHVMQVAPWPDEQVEMMIEVGKEVLNRWPGIEVRAHHGHHDICPGYKQDVAGFPFARVLRGIYGDQAVADVWTPLWTVTQRQRALIEMGFDLGKAGADGDWGRASDAALRAFQVKYGLNVDGMWTTFVNWKAFDVMSGLGKAQAFFGATSSTPVP